MSLYPERTHFHCLSRDVRSPGFLSLRALHPPPPAPASSLQSSGPRVPLAHATCGAGPSPRCSLPSPWHRPHSSLFGPLSLQPCSVGRSRCGEEHETQRSGCPCSQLPGAGRPRRPLPTGAWDAAARSPPGRLKLPLRTSAACAQSGRSVMWTRAAGPETAGCWAARRLTRVRAPLGPRCSPWHQQRVFWLRPSPWRAGAVAGVYTCERGG